MVTIKLISRVIFNAFGENTYFRSKSCRSITLIVLGLLTHHGKFYEDKIDVHVNFHSCTKCNITTC